MHSSDSIRNRADINQQYKDSEFREKNYKKKKRNEIGDSLDNRKRQLKGLGFLFIFLLFGVSAAAQSLQVEKSVGQTLTINWEFGTAQESEIDSFVIENCTGINSGCVDALSPIVAKNLRAWTVVVTAQMAARPFFQVKAIKGTNRSISTNPVALTIKIPPPLGASGH